MTGLRRSHRGFTLLELTIAIGVILVLMALVLSASRRVFSGQEERATKNLLITLDRALSEFISVSGAPPKYDAEFYDEVPGPDNRIEQYLSADHSRRPDASVFVRQVRGYGEVDAIINGIDSRFLQTTIIGGSSTNPNQNSPADPTPSIVDSWARDEAAWKEESYSVVPDPEGDDAPHSGPTLGQSIILYVHPGNALAQDLYGRCLNGRPYFMSAGPDKRFGLTDEFASLPPAERAAAAEKALADNIYSYKPGPYRKEMNER